MYKLAVSYQHGMSQLNVNNICKIETKYLKFKLVFI